MTIDHLQHVVLAFTAVSVSVIGAITDVRSRLIPNRLTGPAMLAGLMLHLVVGGWGEFGRSFLALLLCGGVFLVFHLAGGMGAGDVKLIAAEGCLLGLTSVAPLLVYTALCGGALGLAMAMLRGRVRQTLGNALILTSHHTRHGLQPHHDLNLQNQATLRLPYALAIAAGALLTVVLPLFSQASL